MSDPRTVLVVEDEFAIADLLEMALSDEGYRVVWAANGRQGLDRLAEDPPPDLVISDHELDAGGQRAGAHRQIRGFCPQAVPAGCPDAIGRYCPRFGPTGLLRVRSWQGIARALASIRPGDAMTSSSPPPRHPRGETASARSAG
jgi:hypothetical protein